VFYEPPASSGDLHFRVLGFPVRVHPWFWVVSVLLGFRVKDLGMLAAWVAASFLAILIHELGHAVVMRHYGFFPRITLYSFGGLASYGPEASSYRSRGHDTVGQILISLAGPVAGVFLAAVVVLAARAAGKPVVIFDWIAGFLPLIGIAASDWNWPFLWFLDSLIYIGVFWGAMNLMPIYPLDGGQVAREVLMRLSPQNGVRLSLIVSILTAALAAAFVGLQLRDWYLTLFFAYLAYNSYAMLESYLGRGPF
jgi:stage IV sporulation protein FB